MTNSFEGYFWLVTGTYFLLIGIGRLPMPKRVADRFDAASCERYRAALRAIGPTFILVGSLLFFQLI